MQDDSHTQTMDGFTCRDFYEEHYHTLTRSINPEVFLARLRSARIISESDQEEIQNHYVYKTRMQRTGIFLNILITKGNDGFDKFKELLGWEYPHVFQTIFIDEDPSPAPNGYIVHQDSRKSYDLHQLMKTGFNIEDYIGRYNDIVQQMEDLKELLVFTQMEKKDLEMETQRLRKLEVINRQLRENLKESEKDNRQVKEENREFMRKNIHLRDENDHQATRLQTLLHERDELEKKLDCTSADLDRLSEYRNELQDCYDQERRTSHRLHKQCNDLKNALPRAVNIVSNVNESGDHSRNVLNTKIELLKQDLDEERENNASLYEDLVKVREENYQYKDTINRQTSYICSSKKEAERSVLWLKKAEKHNEEYFNTIQQLQKEKRKVEEEKILAQQKNWELSEQKNVLFQRKHELERQLEKFQREYDKLKDDIMRERLNTYRQQHTAPLTNIDDIIDRIPSSANQQTSSTLPVTSSVHNSDSSSRFGSFSGSTGTIKASEVAGNVVRKSSCGSNRGDNVDSMLVNIGSFKEKNKSKPATKQAVREEEEDIYDNLGRLGSFYSVSSSFSSDSDHDDIFQIDSILSNNSPSRLLKLLMVHVNFEILDSLELEKDREFIKISGFKVQDANLQIGDAIVQLDYQRGSEDINMIFNNVELEEVKLSLRECIDCKPDIVTLYIKPGPVTRKEMLDQGGFYIRSNVTNADPVIKNTNCLPLKEGEVIYVECNHEDEFWKVCKVDQKTGRRMKATGLIPNMDEAKKVFQKGKNDPVSPGSKSQNPGFTRQLAVRFREGSRLNKTSPYSIVLPMTAHALLPVRLCGAETVVAAILDILKTSDIPWANVINEKKSCKDMIKEGKHVVSAYSLGFIPTDREDKDLQYFIMINIVCKQNKSDCLKKLFGAEVIDNCQDVEGLSELNTHSKNLVIDENISDVPVLLQVLQDQISELQSKIFWSTTHCKW